MSAPPKSALTPEEWRASSIVESAGNGERHAPIDDELLYAHGGRSPMVYVRPDGSVGVDNSAGEYGCGELDARKIMALANLSLTLQDKPGEVVQEDVNVCISAAWYFRKLARELVQAANKLEGGERDSFLDHARALTDGNERLHRLAETLQAIVPPQ
jgi:hypothetical protein